jgi:hypothetical protein
VVTPQEFGWTPEGDVIAVHDLLRSELWRFSEVQPDGEMKWQLLVKMRGCGT